MHNQALDAARLNFERAAWDSPERAISKVVISHFNLADCYLALDQIDRAGEFYLNAQNFLLGLMDSAEAERILEAINHALFHVNHIWMELIKQHRDRVSYQRMVEYHEKSRMLSGLEARHAIVH
ncbi:MAG: hypothetical protein RQ899_12100 [Pseudomonadales bacterium]|nr:hypothetical protein [Pseudomonadales bacterium]